MSARRGGPGGGGGGGFVRRAHLLRLLDIAAKLGVLCLLGAQGSYRPDRPKRLLSNTATCGKAVRILQLGMLDLDG
jgi:hypothetical protein